MSTGLECEIITLVTTKEVYYLLQNWNCPVGSCDWHEYATAYGPFTDNGAAYNHLYHNHVNPGASTEYEYQPGTDEAIDNLIAEANKKNERRREYWLKPRHGF